MNFEQSIENYEDLDDIIKEDVKNYMLTLINANNWLDKRLSSSFSRNPWLLNYISKEDLKQDFYLNIYKPKTISGLMKRIGVDRVKYMNSVFSNVLLGNLEKHFGRATYPLNEDLEVSENNVSSFEEKQNLTDLFLDETLEKTLYAG